MAFRTTLLVMTWFGLATTAVADGPFRVGFAQVDVTPTKPMPMWGYGARHALFNKGTRDPLYAKAVVVEAGGAKLAIVGLDLGRSLGEPHYSRIREKLKTDGIEHVMMSGSHTHHGPVLELKDAPGQGQGRYDDAVAYVNDLEQKLVAVIQEATGNLQDARIGWASATVDMNRNRQAKQEPKPRDTELAVIRFDDANGKPLAILVNFAAHPTMLSGSDLRWSAEYPGVMMKTVEAAMQTHCLFMQGAGGDLSAQSRPEDHLPGDDARLQDAALDSAQTALIKSVLRVDDAEAKKLQRDMIAAEFRMESFGRRMGEEVIRVAEGCETKSPHKPSLQGNYEHFDFESRLDFRNPAVVSMFGFAFFPELAAAAGSEISDNKIHTALTTVLLNRELALVGGSGEFFCNHSNRLKERCYAAKTLFFGYCNGHHMYFPTIEAASQGGYGADSQVSWVEIGAGERMMNQALINVFTWQGKLTKSPLAPAEKTP
jgi:neutral ceramidase